MNRKSLVALAIGAVSLIVPLAANAGPALQPACVVITQGPLHIQVGYAPNGPSDCVVLPPA